RRGWRSANRPAFDRHRGNGVEGAQRFESSPAPTEIGFAGRSHGKPGFIPLHETPGLPADQTHRPEQLVGARRSQNTSPQDERTAVSLESNLVQVPAKTAEVASGDRSR